MITFKNLSSDTMKRLAAMELEGIMLRHEEIELAVGLLLRNRDLLDSYQTDSCIKSLMDLVEERKVICSK